MPKIISISKPIIGKEEERAILGVIRSGMLAQGERVKELEDRFASYIGVKDAIAVSNGSAALFLSLLAYGIERGDEVITTPFSFIASSNAILLSLAKPVFVDINASSFNINPDLIEEKITKKTKALLIVHLFGCPCQMDKILKVVKKYKLILIEDACQSHGTEYKGKKVGSFGTGCFSFYATKNMTTGEGGMVTTNDKMIADKIRLLRNHGSKIRYYHEELGFNFRMTDFQAAIGIEQLKKLDKLNGIRVRNALIFNKMLDGVKGIITPKILPDIIHVFHQYTIRVTKQFRQTRDELVLKLKDKGVQTGVFYPLPIHKQKLYKKVGYKDKLSVSEGISKEVLSLPIHPLVTKEDIEYIVSIIRKG